MTDITLSYTDDKGIDLSATFIPEEGMRLAALRYGSNALLGANVYVIGPYYGARPEHLIPTMQAPTAKQTPTNGIAASRQGKEDPFIHGIARYVPWQAQDSTSTQVKAFLDGGAEWHGKRLAEWAGQNFRMYYSAIVDKTGLSMEISIVSEADSLVGFDVLYNIPTEGATLLGQSSSKKWEGCRCESPNKGPLGGESNRFNLDLSSQESLSCCFHPYPDPLKMSLSLQTKELHIHQSYESVSAENCWSLLWQPERYQLQVQSLSSQDPIHPNLTVSSLRQQIWVG